MKGASSFVKYDILFILVTGNVVMVVSTDAKVQGTFKCTTWPKAISCPVNELPNVTNGLFECPSLTNVSNGEMCTLLCDDGFYPAFSKQAVCEAGTANRKGKWSDGNFKCLVITCSINDLRSVTNGSFECSTHSTNVTMGNSCTLSCENGFHLASIDKAVCQEGTQNQGGKWSDGILTCHGCNVWNEWGETEYKVFITEQNWTKSRQMCESESAYLATIENEEENDLLQKMTSYCGSFTYIGLHRMVTGLWEWIDGTNATYTNWGKGHPGTELEKCSYMRTSDGSWGDYYCSYHRNAVCERRKHLK